MRSRRHLRARSNPRCVRRASTGWLSSFLSPPFHRVGLFTRTCRNRRCSYHLVLRFGNRVDNPFHCRIVPDTCEVVVTVIHSFHNAHGVQHGRHVVSRFNRKQPRLVHRKEVPRAGPFVCVFDLVLASVVRSQHQLPVSELGVEVPQIPCSSARRLIRIKPLVNCSGNR